MLVSPDFQIKQKAAFVVFEGINGCGKSTLHKLLSGKLRGSGRDVVDTREPGGTPLGQELRKLLLEWKGEKKSPRTELFLFASDRAEHIDNLIRPALGRGAWVLCDRFMYSTLAFQGYGRGLDLSLIKQANALAVQGTLPDLVILLDLPPEEACKRIQGRNSQSPDAFEDEEIAFHNRIREGFLNIARESDVPFLVLDATQTPEALCSQAARACGIE